MCLYAKKAVCLVGRSARLYWIVAFCSAEKLCGSKRSAYSTHRASLRTVLGKEHLDKDISDPRPSFLANIDKKKTRVVPSDNPIVLFCGGYVPNSSIVDEPIHSLRHKLNNHVLQYGCDDFELFRPEEIESWRDDGVFPDLFSFEVELAAICTSVLLIIESAGSIAELGAFSQHPELKDRLIVLNANGYVNENSFINLGILRDLENSETSETYHFPWNPDNPGDTDTKLLNGILKTINEFLLNFSSEENFNFDKESHVTVLICELVSLFIALQMNEIEKYLSILGYQISRRVLKRKLYLLCEFEILDTEYYGSLFYVRTKASFSEISFRYNKTKQTPTEIKLSCQKFYTSDNHVKRLGAIELYKRRQQ